MNHNNTIYQSKNYDKFRFLESNRMVDFRHVRRLKKSIADIGLIEPIVVNDRLEVIEVFLKCYNRRLKPAKKIQAYQLPNKKIAFQVGE